MSNAVSNAILEAAQKKYVGKTWNCWCGRPHLVKEVFFDEGGLLAYYAPEDARYNPGYLISSLLDEHSTEESVP